jgi:hypothetical protein
MPKRGRWYAGQPTFCVGSWRGRAGITGPGPRGSPGHLVGVPLGAFREEALDVCPALYGKASGTPHGGVADPARAAALYRQLLAAAKELPVPLPGRAGRVLELAARPPQTGSRRRGNWPAGQTRAPPRSSSTPARPRSLLHEQAPHLLAADEAAGVWPAAPFLEHLATAPPGTVRRGWPTTPSSSPPSARWRCVRCCAWPTPAPSLENAQVSEPVRLDVRDQRSRDNLRRSTTRRCRSRPRSATNLPLGLASEGP